ncbi:hypothetical protein [Dialister micraerophilus]|uniref:hypothetical protein n=1 Tax=Dialister micraerophilus TaxID=309120 RepID=UPI0023F433CA|nr:hypothetical protein [Dialister micraerophilus]
MIDLFHRIIQINDVRIWCFFIGIWVFIYLLFTYFLKQKENKLIKVILIGIPSVLMILSCVIAFLEMINSINSNLSLFSAICFELAGITGTISFRLQMTKYSNIFVKKESDYKRLRETFICCFLGTIISIIPIILLGLCLKD